MILLGAIAAAVIILDRIAKLAIINNMELYQSVPVIKHIINFTYVKNTGAAFSIFENGNKILAFLSGAIILMILGYVWHKKFNNKLLYVAVGMLIGGAIGNVVDRITYRCVIDYIDLQFIKFAVFNIADCFVVIGCILLGIHILFAEKPREAEATDEKL